MVVTRTRAIDEDSPLVPGELDGITLDEFLALPEATPALEYEDGRVTQKVPPQGQHSVLQRALVNLFDRFGQPERVALAFPELRTTYHGARRSFVPDVAVYRWERIPRLPTGEVANRFIEPPDVAVEIVSPEQSVSSVVPKCLWYVEHGVRAALLVDPDDRSVFLFRSGGPPAALRDDAQIDLRDVIPGFLVTVAEVFAALRLD